MKRGNIPGLALLLLCLLAFETQDELTLTINISGGLKHKGQVLISLFNSPENFLKEPVASGTVPVNKEGGAVYLAHPLKKGKYAVSAIYDEDNNGELTTGFLGIPRELVGFSNNAKGSFGPPSFDQTSFVLSESETIEIVLGKAKD